MSDPARVRSVLYHSDTVQFSLEVLGLLVLQYIYFFTPNTRCALVVALSEKKEVPVSMAMGDVELMQECFPKH